MMNPHRHVKPQIITCAPRTSLTSSSHAHLDSALKELKLHSRRLQSAIVAHTDEYLILERVYYKGKNQHRTALFWRRVTEIRKYSNRLDGMAVNNIMDNFRYSFFGGGSHKNSKLLKGSWTHFPDMNFVTYTLERLDACFALANKMHERLLEAYRSFTLAMQSGAFLQLVLILVAIASRMDILAIEIRESLEVTRLTIRRIWLVLQTPEARISIPTAKAHDSPFAIDSAVSGYHGSAAQPLGATLDQVPSPAKSVNMSALAGPVSPASSTGLRSLVTVERRVVPKALGRKLPLEKSKRTIDIKADKQRKKKRTTKDEIDDIFGS